PAKVESFRVGLGARGVALDSKGKCWVASLVSPGFPPPKIPDGASIMEQFKILSDALAPFAVENPKKTTGVASMIRPDGPRPAPKGYDGGGAINVPWGMVIDGNDDVWVGNGLGRTERSSEGHEDGRPHLQLPTPHHPDSDRRFG